MACGNRIQAVLEVQPTITDGKPNVSHGADVYKRQMNMSEKRRDNKGRILRTGESQRKNGMYEFRYTDANKKRRSIYDMDLMKLRQKEDEIKLLRHEAVSYTHLSKVDDPVSEHIHILRNFIPVKR